MTLSKKTLRQPIFNTLAFAIATVLSASANATLFDNAVENGTFIQANNISHNFINNLTVNGNWNLNSIGNVTAMNFQGAQTIGGIGFINMSNSTANRIASDNTLLTIGNALTIRGAGNLGLGHTSFNNFGAILATQSSTLTINSGSFTNNGTVRAEGTGGLVIVNTTMVNNSSVDVNAGSKLQLSSSTLNGVFNNTAGGSMTASANTFNAAVINGNMVQANNTSNTFTNGLTINNGAWSLNSAGNFTNMSFVGAQTIGGNGEIVMSNSTANRIFSDNTLLTIGNALTIRGAGQLGLGQTSIDNQGTILAQHASTLTIVSDDFTNNGTLRAEGTGGLVINNTTLNNNTSVDVNNNSKLQLTSSTVNGVFNNVAGGSMRATNTVFDNATVNGVMTQINNTSNTIKNGLTNNGTWNLNSVGNFTNLIFDGSQSLSGDGEIVMSNHTSNRIYTANAGETLTIGANSVIRGAGQLGIGQTDIVNNGTVLSQGSQRLIITSDAFTNNNVMRAEGTGGLDIINTILHNTSSVDVDAGSKLQINSSTVDGVFNNNGGTMTATASIFDGATINGVMTQANNTSNTVTNGLTVNGSWRLNSLGNPTDLKFIGAQTIGGTGEVLMSNSTANRIYSTDGTPLTIGANLTIRGAGNIGDNQTTVINNGTILAQQSQQLVIDSDDFTNNGVMRAEGSGGFNILNSTLHNTSSVDVAIDSKLQINGSTVDGVFNNNGGTMTAASSIFDGATINGIMTQANNTSNTFINGLTVNGSWRLNSLGNPTDLKFTGAQTIGGTGEVLMSNTTANRIYSTDGTPLTIGTNLTIRGAGNIGDNQTTVINNGTILAQQSQQLVIDSDDFTNNSVMRAEGSGGLFITGSTLHNNTSIDVDAGSKLQISGSTVDGVFNNNGGTMTAASSIFDGATINGVMTQANNTSNTVTNGLTVNGSWRLNSLGNPTDLKFTGAQTLGGTGEVLMSNSTANRIYSTDSATLTIGSNLTIRGAGNIGVNQTTVINNGTILAQQSQQLVIDSDDFTNNGVMRAEGSGGFNILNSTLHNTSSVDVDTGSKLQINGSTVDGVFNNNGGTMTAASSTFDGATINGVMTQANNTSNTVTSGLTVNGSWHLNSLGNPTDLKFTGAQTIGGTGEVLMSNSTANRIYSTDSATLTVGSNLTIRGAGSLGLNQTQIINKGTITANLSQPINIATNGTGFDNRGNLNATGGGGINITAGAFTNSGNVEIAAGSKINRTGTFVQTAGHTNVDGTLTSSGLVDIQGGLLSGTGLINGDVINAGTVGPGNSPGQLTINGDYTQTLAGLLNIELAGLIAGAEYDVLNVSDNANLAGLLEVDVLASFNPVIGNSFDILRADSIFGTFDTLSLDSAYIWQVDYLEDIFGLNTTDVVRLTILDVSQVPVPAAVWLFGSGLIGLVGVARRKTLH